MASGVVLKSLACAAVTTLLSPLPCDWSVSGQQPPPPLCFQYAVCSTAIKSRSQRRWVCQQQNERPRAQTLLLYWPWLWICDRPQQQINWKPVGRSATFTLLMRDLQAPLSPPSHLFTLIYYNTRLWETCRYALTRCYSEKWSLPRDKADSTHQSESTDYL